MVRLPPDDDRPNEEPLWGTRRVSTAKGRRHPRYPMDLSVEYQVLKASLLKPPYVPHAGRAEEVSKGGLRLLLPERLPPLTVIQCTLSLPERSIGAEAEIVWVERAEETLGKKPGVPCSTILQGVRHGVQFLRMNPEDGEVWERFLSEGIHKPIGLPADTKRSSPPGGGGR